jgi:hypothetical protein
MARSQPDLNRRNSRILPQAARSELGVMSASLLANLHIAMPSPPTLSDFHRWLLGESGACGSTAAIVLHLGPTVAAKHLSARIATYLNEYDGDSEGRWFAIPGDLVAAIASDAPHRALLGLGEGCINCPPASPCGLKKTLAALAGLGHVILDSPLAAAATREMQGVFHVGVGLPPDGLDDCHVIVNPEIFPNQCLPQVIADVFLEWFACDQRGTPRIATIR